MIDQVTLETRDTLTGYNVYRDGDLVSSVDANTTENDRRHERTGRLGSLQCAVNQPHEHACVFEDGTKRERSQNQPDRHEHA